MARIEKKIWPRNFEDVASGKRQYEPRLQDFKVSSGDTLVLREWDPKMGKYTGRKIEKRVREIHTLSPQEIRKYWTQEEIERYGIQIIQFE